jgi:hypothetical protein
VDSVAEAQSQLQPSLAQCHNENASVFKEAKASVGAQRRALLEVAKPHQRQLKHAPILQIFQTHCLLRTAPHAKNVKAPKQAQPTNFLTPNFNLNQPRGPSGVQDKVG